MAEDNDLPTSRVGRGALLGRVAAGQVARHAGAKIATVGRSDERKREVFDKRQAEAIKAIVDGLGMMRGAAMKVGQMASMIDIGLVPDELRPDFQRAMASLRDSAPTVSWDKMRKVVETDLGTPLRQAFADFDSTPLAAASIGQVYRATLGDGRDVVVKVQYPGVDKAVRADLKNLGMIAKAAKLIAPELDISAMVSEVRDRTEEELDYELEAQNQRMARRLYLDHPFIVVPDVVSSLCGPHVLVTEYFDGKRFDDILDADQAVRDRVGEIVYRFFAGSLYQHRQFSPDPHPGNFLLGADGRVAFLDFGLYRHMDAAVMTEQMAVLRAILERDADKLHPLMVASGFLPASSNVVIEPKLALKYALEVFWWMSKDEVVSLDPETASAAMTQTINPTSEYFNAARHQNMPADYVFLMRMVVMVMAALGQLRASGNWYRIAREWLYDDVPATELGRLDAEYRSGRVATPSR